MVVLLTHILLIHWGIIWYKEQLKLNAHLLSKHIPAEERCTRCITSEFQDQLQAPTLHICIHLVQLGPALRYYYFLRYRKEFAKDPKLYRYQRRVVHLTTSRLRLWESLMEARGPVPFSFQAVAQEAVCIGGGVYRCWCGLLPAQNQILL
ncbi:uncharacterized protein LOC129584389 [Paramacrobiotus metropolitanus]|uniref:uncharacterized protein LOC129584389 n=1 Tax=Paramacrobiotus metropolitanus TaxID=2943436 RepID=UPI002445AA24|nr:uncharacterized protein LOC129584389 [Paramacrobiotus metropolitanus]